METRADSRAVAQPDGTINIAGNKLFLVDATKEDRSFIISSWVKSYAQINRKLRIVFNDNSNYSLTRMASDDVFDAHHPLIAEAMWCEAKVLKGDLNDHTNYGFIVTEQPSTLHYVYVVHELRRLGLADAMIRLEIGKYVENTHIWPYGKRESWKFNPYKAMCYGHRDR